MRVVGEAVLQRLGLLDVIRDLDSDEERVRSEDVQELRRELAEAPHNVEELINVRLSREQRRARRHLRQHAPNRPDIDRFAILRVSGKELRPSVPARGDIIGVACARAGEGAREAEIAELEDAVARDEEVLRAQGREGW